MWNNTLREKFNFYFTMFISNNDTLFHLWWKENLVKYRKSINTSFQVRQILALFCNLIALILGENCVKRLRVTRIVKQIKFKRAWNDLEAKICFWRQTLVFMWNNTTTVKFQFLFLSSFLLLLTKPLFSEEDWALAYNSLKFYDFLDISLFPKQ